MYDSWSDQWEGLTKNAYAGLEHNPMKAVAIGLAVLLCNVLGPVYVAASMIWLMVSPGWASITASILSLLTVLLPAAALNIVRRMFHLPWYYAFAMPLGSAVYLAILIASAWRYHRGGNLWKGRSYGGASG